MTDKEIIEAFIGCINKRLECTDCQYGKNLDCMTDMYDNIIDLIKRQQAEIERLESIISTDNQLMKSLNKCYEISKAEAIKEFAEKLKRKAYQFPCAIGTEYAVPIRAINEMAGGEE